jgi:hypothetical protein
MLAAAGALAPELLGQLGLIPASTALPWFEAGGLFSSSPGELLDAEKRRSAQCTCTPSLTAKGARAFA